MQTKLGFSVVTLCAIAGCGGTVMSPSKLTASEGSVRGAEEVGARDEPKAGLHLKLAQDEVKKAKSLSESGDGEAADRMLTRAQVDADLAIAVTNEAKTWRAAQLVSAEVEKARGGVK
ncbi:MAG: DUF4398 domain-containing protein [Myxococcales bacterium]|nr:DUF4398 domain-containing protein [Myxococcales bacterium]